MILPRLWLCLHFMHLPLPVYYTRMAPQSCNGLDALSLLMIIRVARQLCLVQIDSLGSTGEMGWQEPPKWPYFTWWKLFLDGSWDS